jgi:hypothetical protein
MDQSSTPDTWKAWTAEISGDDTEDLADVFRNVRRDKTAATQIKWAQDWRTRAFCDLGLHLLYEHHIRRAAGRREDSRIFANIQASDLQTHAQLGFFDAQAAERLNVDRFNSTWGQQSAYCQDLIAYLFRPAPWMHRLSRVHPQLQDMTQELTLGEWVRRAAKMELDYVATSPLVSLHIFIEAVLPQDPDVQSKVHRLRHMRLQQWALLYERVFTAYGVQLRPISDLDWLGVAERFSTLTGGAVLRMQTRGTDWTTSGTDGETFGQMLIEYAPGVLDIDPADIDTRRSVRHPGVPIAADHS